jgi:uncharacterized protein YndB with AHSA1/START domain
MARAVNITRVFDAPRALVWKVFTQPEHVMQWWGPKHFTAPYCKMDFRVGGKFHYCMRDENGKDYWTTGKYLEIVPIEKIVATDSFSDAEGNIVSAAEHGLPGNWPDELFVKLTFADEGNKTRFTLRHEGIPDGEMAEATSAGWQESLDKLEQTLKNA